MIKSKAEAIEKSQSGEIDIGLSCVNIISARLEQFETALNPEFSTPYKEDGLAFLSKKQEFGLTLVLKKMFTNENIPCIGGYIGITEDGLETTWTLDFTSNQNSLLVVLGGQIQEPGIDFTCPVGSNQLSFTTAPAAAAICYVIFLGQELTSMSNPTMADLQAAIDVSEANITTATVDEAVYYASALGSL